MRTRGFTLVETMLTLFIVVLIMGAISEVLIVLTQQGNYRFASIDSTDQVRMVSKQFVNEIRNAQSGSDGSFAITQASTTQIIFFTSFGATSSASVRRIRYFIATSTATTTLYRGVVVPTGSPPVYVMTNEVVRPIVKNVLFGTSSVFTYYDGTYAGTSSPLAQPVNLTQIALVKMNLKVLQQDARYATTTFNFSAGSSIRSLKTNLGN